MNFNLPQISGVNKTLQSYNDTKDDRKKETKEKKRKLTLKDKNKTSSSESKDTLKRKDKLDERI